jgi:hypothetical protein
VADIFVSFTKQNEAVVTDLVNALRTYGYDLFFYPADTVFGGELTETLPKEIKAAHLALICFDDETYQKEWITTEVAWCIDAINSPELPMKQLIPVWVGPHPGNKLPALITGRYPAFDLGDGSNNRILDLVNRMAASLPAETRRLVLGAIYAMTAQQFTDVRNTNPTVAGLAFYDFIDEVCASLGMPSRPELLDLLEKRYGQTPEDIRPFDGEPSVVEMIYDNVRTVNSGRGGEGDSKKLAIRWVREELGGLKGIKEHDEVYAKWETSDSLLIVDSLSMWSEPVRMDFLNAAPVITNSAIIWIPPFTQKTGTLFPKLSGSWSIVNSVRNELFVKSKGDPYRKVSFDANNAFALSRWLHRVLDEVEGKTRAFAETLQGFVDHSPGTAVRPGQY